MSSLFTDLTPGVKLRQSRQSQVAIKCLDHRNSSGVAHGETNDLPSSNSSGNLAKIINMPSATSMMPLNEAEKEARGQAEHRQFVLFLANLSAALYVFLVYFIASFESILSISLGVGLTLYFYYTHLGDDTWNGSMNWTLVTFAVVTPMSVSIGLAFQRREQALRDIAVFRSCAYQLYLAHACWDWGTIKNPSSGRDMPSNDMDWLKHSDEAMHLLLGMADKLCHYLTLPCFSRARHRVTNRGRREASRTAEVAYRFFDSLMTTDMAKFSILTETLKRYGLPANEASRIRQWERFVGEAIEDLRMIKTYRTPQALRSFARIFTIFLPAFYSPDFCQLARSSNSLGLGIAFAIITSISLTALFESIYILEDPFVAHLTLDGIDVQEELCVLHWFQLVNAREVIFPGAHAFRERSSITTTTNYKKENENSTNNDEVPPVKIDVLQEQDNGADVLVEEDGDKRISAYSPRLTNTKPKLRDKVRDMFNIETIHE